MDEPIYIYAVIISVLLIACVAGLIFFWVKYRKSKKSVDKVATENLRKGKEEASELIRHTMDKIQDDKNKLNGMTDRELSIETMLALSGYARRLDRIEEKLQGIYNYKACTEAITEQIKGISNMSLELKNNIVSTTNGVESFKQCITLTKTDVDRLNQSISDVGLLNNRICALIGNINNSLSQLTEMNEHLVSLEKQIQGVYAYKQYLEDIVTQVNTSQELTQKLNNGISEYDNKIRNFNITVSNAYSSVDKLNNSISGVEDIKGRIITVMNAMSNSVQGISNMNNNLISIMQTTNNAIKNYGDSPMVKISNIESQVGDLRSLVKATNSVMNNMKNELSRKLDELSDVNYSIEQIESEIKGVSEVIDKALGNEYDYNSVYWKIDEVKSSIDDVKSAIDDISHSSY